MRPSRACGACCAALPNHPSVACALDVRRMTHESHRGCHCQDLGRSSCCGCHRDCRVEARNARGRQLPSCGHAIETARKYSALAAGKYSALHGLAFGASQSCCCCCHDASTRFRFEDFDFGIEALYFRPRENESSCRARRFPAWPPKDFPIGTQ